MGRRSWAGEPAFPRAAERYPDGSKNHEGCDGMDLRTWLAGQALAGALAGGHSGERAAEVALRAADALLLGLGGTTVGT